MNTLAAELAQDPAGLGYAGMSAAQIEAAINAKTRTRVQSLMLSERGLMERYPGGPLAADALLAKLEAFAASGVPGSGPVKRAMKFLAQPEGMDIGSDATQGQLTALGAAGVITAEEANAVKALAQVPCSRADQLGLPYVTDQMIREAL